MTPEERAEIIPSVCNQTLLTPAPWNVFPVSDFTRPHTALELWYDDDVPVCTLDRHALRDKEAAEADAAFIALARSAFDVMVRRKWYAYPATLDGSFWSVGGMPVADERAYGRPTFRDPFTALVEADRWYKENVEVRP